MNNKLIILTGPTAVGKTALSIKLAKEINGQIISADSIQVYKGLDIGSAKVTPSEMQGVKHHLIDVLSPDEDFNVYLFQKYAKNAIQKIYSENSIPIIVGGTGFYIQSVLYDIDFSEEDNSEIRQRLELEATTIGPELLHQKLQTLDPEYAVTVHYNNVRKVIRALEYIELNNSLFSEHNKAEREKESKYNFNYFVLNDYRDNIYSNIEKRVDIMIENGLVNEVSQLLNNGINTSMVSMQGLGYKEIAQYLNDEISLDDAIAKIKLETRHFAKRQLTWFRREKNVTWINKYDYDYDDDKILDFMLKEI